MPASVARQPPAVARKPNSNQREAAVPTTLDPTVVVILVYYVYYVYT